MGGWRFAPACALLAWLVACTPAAEKQPATAQGDPALAAEVEQLRAELERQRAANRELSAQVEWMRNELGALASLEAAQEQAGAGTAADAGGTDEATGGEAEGGGPGARSEDVWFDDAALAEAGVPPDEIERLREVFERSEMEMIALRNQATREGWLRAQRFHQEVLARRAGLREELGDGSFDLLLYATGRNNRVIVADVLRGSPGERAGLQPGDVLIAYGERRVFHPIELQHATTGGKAGDRVPVWVLRDGERLRLHLEFGPIGAKLRSGRMLPEEPW
jgi:hypothetical protein